MTEFLSYSEANRFRNHLEETEGGIYEVRATQNGAWRVVPYEPLYAPGPGPDAEVVECG